MYLPAIHEGFIRTINPWLCRDTVCGPRECEAKCIVKEHHSQAGQNLGPKTAISSTNSGVVCVNKAVKKIKMFP